MAIYLDANMLWPSRTFEELDRLALSIVAHQIGQSVFVPEVAAREAEEIQRRSLERAISCHDAAVEELQRKFREEIDIDFGESQPWVPDEVELWNARLGALAQTIPTEPIDTVEALEREIVGRPPAKARVKGNPGSGARDAAIWLTILRNHRLADEPGELRHQQLE